MDSLLDASLSPDQSTRTQAEAALANVPATDLIEFVRVSTNDARRLSALVYLKNYVLHRWSTQFAEFSGPLCPQDERHALRHECFRLLGDGNRAIRSQAGFIVSKIIASDYPDEWATVLDDLMGILARPKSESWLHGGLVVMKDFVDDSMSEEQFLPIAQNLVQYLLAITRNASHSDEIRAYAVDVFMSCLDSLEMLSSTRREGIRVFVDGALPPWLETIVHLINNDSASPSLLKTRCLETIIKLRLLFPSQLVQYLPAVFRPVYESLQKTDHLDADSAKFTELQIEFIRKAIQAKVIVEEVLTDKSIFDGTIQLSLKFAQITEVVHEAWEIDMDLFIEDLEETAFSTRHLCTDLVEDLQKINSTWTAEALEQAIAYYFVQQSSSDVLTAEREALIFIHIALVQKTQQLQKVLEVALSSKNAFLAGRGAIYAAQLGVVECFEEVCRQLSSEHVVLKLCAIKAISKYADTQEQVTRSSQAMLLRMMVLNLDKLPISGYLMLAESLASIINLEPSVVLTSDSPLPSLFTILAGNPGDISLVSTVVDIFETLAGTVDFEALCNAILPVLFRTISEEAQLRSIAFDILNGIIEGSEKALPPGFVDTIWPVFSIPMEVEEEQTAHEILRNLVKKAWIQIVSGNHVDSLLNLIGTAFSNGDESTSFYIPQLVISLIRQSGDQLATIMPKLLEIIIEKLKTPGLSTSYQQNLISVFAEIAITQGKPLVEFLVRSNGLEIVLGTWCEVFPDFHGYASIRASIVGLAQIYASANPNLTQVTVKGDLIPDTSGKILTRSRAKNNPDRYTSIPLPVKIVKLFLSELVNEMEGKNDDEEVVSDDEWESTDLSKIIEDAQLDEAEFNRLSEDEDDSLKEVNTREFVVTFLKAHFSNGGGGGGSDGRGSAEIAAQLTPGEQETLHSVLLS